MKIPEVAKVLKVSTATVWRWVFSRKIESIKVGTSRRISSHVLEHFIAEGIVPANTTNKETN
jgi:excisionase family DNA binding protein